MGKGQVAEGSLFQLKDREDLIRSLHYRQGFLHFFSEHILPLTTLCSLLLVFHFKTLWHDPAREAGIHLLLTAFGFCC